MTFLTLVYRLFTATMRFWRRLRRGMRAGDGGGLGSLADTAAVVDDLLDRSGDAPVVRLINALLLEAIRERASDIHIETQEKRLVVRLRIDGILRPVLEPKRALRPASGQPHQGDGAPRHRRKAPAPGRPGVAAGGPPRGRRAGVHHPLAVRRAGGLCAFWTATRPGWGWTAWA